MFAFDLADRLGVTVSWLKANMSLEEFQGWRAWSKLRGPLSRDVQADLRTARICAAAMRAAGVKDVKLADFLPDWESDQVPLEEDQRVLIQAKATENREKLRPKLDAMKQARREARQAKLRQQP